MLAVMAEADADWVGDAVDDAGGPVKFVLSTSGHIASMVKPAAAPGTYVHDH
jgi:poly(3-hydroxyalkanoate) synthetase